MKNLLFLLVGTLFIVITAFAQAPESINYQAVARDNAGKILENKNISLIFSILSGSATGTIEFSETQIVLTNEFGVFTLKVGNGSVVSGSFSDIDWGNNSFYIKIDMDEAGGSNYKFMGTSQLLSVPYALYAKESGGNLNYTSGMGINIAGSTISAENTTAIWNASSLQGNSISTSVPATDQVLTWNGTEWEPQTGAGSGSSAWSNSVNDIYYNKGNVSIGTKGVYSNNNLTVTDSTTPNISANIFSYTLGSASSTAMSRGIYAIIGGTNGDNLAIHGIAEGTSNGNNRGVAGFANNSTFSNIGVYGRTDDDNSLTNVGTYGQATGSSDGGTSNTAFNLGIQGFAGNCEDVNYGVYGSANGSGVENYGLAGSSRDAGSGINIGVLARGENGSTNYGGYFISPGLAGYFSGNVSYTGTLTGPSDAKLKENVQEIQSVLPLLNSLKPVVYEYKNDEYKNMNLPEGQQYGFIAQELEEVFPLLVEDLINLNKDYTAMDEINDLPDLDDKSDNTQVAKMNISVAAVENRNATSKNNPIEYKGINYIGLIPILTQAIQEQQLIIENLGDQNNLLLEKLSKLETRIEVLESE